jgi:hypothetical protein
MLKQMTITLATFICESKPGVRQHVISALIDVSSVLTDKSHAGTAIPAYALSAAAAQFACELIATNCNSAAEYG